jgi:ATP-dependent DNA helicase RecG
MRDERLYALFAPLTSLSGVGAKLGRLIGDHIEGERVLDLVLFLPHQIQRRRQAERMSDLIPGELATVTGRVAGLVQGHGASPHKVRLMDETGFLTLVYFAWPWARMGQMFPQNAPITVSGRVEEYRNERQMTHPDWALPPDAAARRPAREWEPVYRLTAGLGMGRMQALCSAALSAVPEGLPEWIDGPLVAERGWPSWRAALAALHTPVSGDADTLATARERLAYDEAFARQLGFGLARQARAARHTPALKTSGDRVEAMLAGFPHPPTGAQVRAIADIRADLGRATPMHRMLQGDVGAGKTLVAAAACALAAEAGYQSALMAPTEVLARQQGEVLKRLLEPAGLRVELLTGRERGKGREALLVDLSAHSIDVLVGTHALNTDGVSFARLGLVIIDEQHRFGVNDRQRLAAKAVAAHVLAMSATPIPRSLALAALGDLDVSVLDEKPAGRLPVTTRAVPLSRLEEVLEAVGRALTHGEQAFWVCPSVEGEADEAAATQRRVMLADALGIEVGLVHGKLKPRDKDAALEAFRAGETRLLVATTVVEVGVDIPAATIMLIEGAERFGLAQLHQLRGRVGRGSKPASCVLLYHPPLSDTARERLDALRRTHDGFEIAETDFRLRGPGDVLGLRQSGLPAYRLLDLSAHAGLIPVADKDARVLLSREPKLDGARGRAGQLALTMFSPLGAGETFGAG